MLVNKGELPVTMQPKRQAWVVFAGEEYVGAGHVMEEPLPLASGGTYPRGLVLTHCPSPGLCTLRAVGAGQAVCCWLGWLSPLGSTASVPAGSLGMFPTCRGSCAPTACLASRAVKALLGSCLCVRWGKFSSFWSGSWFPYANSLCVEDLTWGGSLAKASPLRAPVRSPALLLLPGVMPAHPGAGVPVWVSLDSQAFG